MINLEIERAGIPVAQIAAVVDITRAIGTSRNVRGFAITSPVGNPHLNFDEEELNRERYVQTAVGLLAKEAAPGIIVDP
ncbi:MAG: hypothetical protein PHU38_03875 [Eubacteriales bacterium]|nr:hypothetical protein [Eubacteriales bacterium]